MSSAYLYTYVYNGDPITFADDVTCLPDGGICYIGEQNDISSSPLERLGDAVECISCILDYEDVLRGTVDLSGDIAAHLIDEHLRFSSEPLIGVELGTLLDAAAVLNDAFGSVAVAAVIDVDELWVYVKIS